MNRIFRLNLLARILVIVIVVTVAGFGAVILKVIEREKENLLREKAVGSELMARPILHTIYEEMLNERAELTRYLVESMKNTKGIERVQIIRADGVEEAFMDFKTLRSIEKEYGKLEPAWVSGHPDNAVNVADGVENPGFKEALELFEAGRQEGVHYVENVDSMRLFTYLVPIEKRAKCNSCHTGEGARGVLMISTSLEGMYAELASSRTRWLEYGLLTVLLVCFFLSIVVRRFVTEPITRTAAIFKVIAEEGNLDHEVGPYAADEVGDMSRAFDKMCEDLKKVTASRDELDREIIMRRRIEERLANAQRMEVVGNLTAGVAHEVRNPLNSLMALSDALNKELGDNPDCVQLLTHIRTQVNRLSVLMRSLLDLGKPLGKSDLKPVDLVSVCSDALEFCRQVTDGNSHKFTLVAPERPASRLRVIGEGERLTQVFVNLLENAAYHSPSGSEITLVINKPENGWCRVSVVDRGPGVPEEVLDRIFEPFFSTRRGGTGLGLSIVKNTVESFGGKVALYNKEPGPGCAIEVVLPVYQA